MGNEHFWQVPRAKGVYARSMHGPRRESSSWGRYQRTTKPAHARNRISGITEVGDIHTLRVDDVLLMIFLGEGQEL